MVGERATSGYTPQMQPTEQMQPAQPPQLTTTFPIEQFASALASWDWLLGDIPLQPKFTSLFGDVFFAAPDNAIWYLDTVAGSLERVWGSRAELVATLDTEQGLDRYLSGVWAMAALRLGLQLGPDDVYDWTVPPAMGASFESANISVRPFVVAVNIAGQLHRQLHELPEGAQITGVQVVQEPGP